jgi:hypothetical protein
MHAISYETFPQFYSSADRFFKEEFDLEVDEIVVRSIYLYHFDSFSIAYNLHQKSPSETSRDLIMRIIAIAKGGSCL